LKSFPIRSALMNFCSIERRYICPAVRAIKKEWYRCTGG
jgi:hypothetical protein